jgi:diaminopimelate decarboxylase
MSAKGLVEFTPVVFNISARIHIIGELERVLAAGGKAGQCVFSGVAKTVIEIERALEVGVRFLSAL